tara:strand:- start:12100 stop:12579 length:480 start_codon:yes stop_codon:yes gene_type:complete
MIKKGDRLPNITLRSVAADGTQNFIFHERFKNKKALIICVPGAFTSTCHVKHLPPFVKGAERLISEKELDYLCCVTTNDPYVLDKWRESFGNSKITFLSDGNHELLNYTQLIRNYEKSFMGNRFIRSIIIIKNLEIENVTYDNPGELDKTSFESILKTL